MGGWGEVFDDVDALDDQAEEGEAPLGDFLVDDGRGQGLH